MGRVALFLSPHLDDAVLSCPAYMQHLVREGFQVRVATVFTEAGAGAAALYRNRRAEDRKAARSLGAAVTHLGFPDAPFRSPEYRDFPGIVFGQAPEYPSTCRLVAQKIRQLISSFRPALVVSPLAVGNHIDHRLVRDAALGAAAPEDLLFYEDRPYAFIREQVNHVLGRNLAGQPERFWNRYFAAAYVRAYRGTASAGCIRQAWATVPPFPREYRLRRASAEPAQPPELARAVAAIGAYRTQMADLFADEAEMEALYRRVPERLYRVARARAGTPAATVIRS